MKEEINITSDMNIVLKTGIGDQCKILDFHTIKSTYLGEDQFGIN